MLSMHEHPETNDCYFLHPELVDSANKTVCLCSKCNDCATSKEGKCSKSIENRNDFGDALRLGLTKITPVERSAIAKVRLYHVMCKLKALCGPLRNSMKGHAIAFPHDAPQKTADFFTCKLDNNQIEEIMKEISVCFVGSDGEIDKLMLNCLNSCSRSLHARGHVVYQWLAVLKAINCECENMNLPQLEKVKEFCEQSKESLIKDSLPINDKESLKFEKQLSEQNKSQKQ